MEPIAMRMSMHSNHSQDHVCVSDRVRNNEFRTKDKTTKKKKKNNSTLKTKDEQLKTKTENKKQKKKLPFEMIQKEK